MSRAVETLRRIQRRSDTEMGRAPRKQRERLVTRAKPGTQRSENGGREREREREKREADTEGRPLQLYYRCATGWSVRGR